MIRRTKRLFAAAATAVALAAILPAAPASAMATCQLRSLANLQTGQTNIIYGTYTTVGALDISMTCGIVRNGVTVRRFSEKVPGPVAVVADTSTDWGYFTPCHEITVTYADGREPYVTDSCP